MSARAVIREMTAADVARVVEIEAVCYSTPWSETTFRQLLRRRDTDLLVAELNATIAGYAAVWTVLDQAELGNLAVAPDRRRQGIGSRLLRAAEQRVRRRGVRELYLEVRTSNEVARGLYGHNGFEEVGRRVAYYTNPVEDALVLKKWLGSHRPGSDGQRKDRDEHVP